MSALAQQRCLQHPTREAVCACPLCRRCFCRECVTEHEGRLLCVACLRRLAASVSPRPAADWASLRRLLAQASPLVGLLLAWGVFYLLGRLILSLTGT